MSRRTPSGLAGGETFSSTRSIAHVTRRVFIADRGSFDRESYDTERFTTFRGKRQRACAKKISQWKNQTVVAQWKKVTHVRTTISRTNKCVTSATEVGNFISSYFSNSNLYYCVTQKTFFTIIWHRNVKIIRNYDHDVYTKYHV